jgi:hypothetical protein
MLVGRLGDGRRVGEAAEASRAAPLAPEPPRALDLLVDGLAAALLDEAGAITAATGDARVLSPSGARRLVRPGGADVRAD